MIKINASNNNFTCISKHQFWVVTFSQNWQIFSLLFVVMQNSTTVMIHVV